MPECDIYLLNLQHDTSAAAGRAGGLPERHGELLTFKTDTMQQIRDFGQLTEQLRAAGRRKRVAVVCPGDTHTEYVIRNDGRAWNLESRNGTECDDDIRTGCSRA